MVDRFIWSWGRLWVRGDQPTVEYNPILVESVPSVRSIVTGSKRIVALTHDGQVFEWGDYSSAISNEADTKMTSKKAQSSKTKERKFDELPSGLTELTASYVSCSRDRIYAVDALSHQVYCWNTLSQNTHLQSSPGAVKKNNIFSHPVVFETLRSFQISKVSCGSGFCIAISTAGKLYSWGRPTRGRLGLGYVDAKTLFPESTANVTTPRLIETLAEECVEHVACGWAHAAAVLNDGSVYTWGCGGSGRLGNDSDGDEHIPVKVLKLQGKAMTDIACGYHHTMCIDTSGNLYAWGGGDKGQLGAGDWEHSAVPRRVVFSSSSAKVPAIQKMSCGAFHSAAISDQGELYTWGWNEFGQLGLGDSVSRNTPHHVTGLNGMDVSMVAAAGDFTVVLSNQFMTVQNDYFPPTQSPPKKNVEDEEPHRGSPIPVVFEEVTMEELSPPALNDVHISTIPFGASGANSPVISQKHSRSSSPRMHHHHHEEAQFQQQQQQQQQQRKRLSSAHMREMDRPTKKGLLLLVKEALSSSSSPSSLPSGQVLDVKDAPYRPPKMVVPKTQAEARKHNGEVARMNKLYREKLQRKAKGKAVQRQHAAKKKENLLKAKRDEEKAHRKREQRLDDAVHFWLDTMYPNWDKPKVRAKGVEMLFEVGVPPRIRGKIWMRAIGNLLMVTPQLYEIRRKQAAEARAQYVDYKKRLAETYGQSSSNSNVIVEPVLDDLKVFGREASLKIMDADLPRTFPSLAFFQDGQAMNAQLKEVLDTSCFYRPDLGYVQGMSYLAGNFLLYMPTYDAFVCFANLMSTPLFYTLYSLADQGDETDGVMLPRYELCKSILKNNLPKVATLIEHEVQVEFLHFTFRKWFMSMYCNGLELDVAGRISDLFFFCGEEAIYRAAVGIFACIQSRLLNSDADNCMMIIQQAPVTLQEDELLSAMAKVKLSSEHLAQIKKLSSPV